MSNWRLRYYGKYKSIVATRWNEEPGGDTHLDWIGFASLDDARLEMAIQGLKRIDRKDDDPPYVIEHWVEPDADVSD